VPKLWQALLGRRSSAAEQRQLVPSGFVFEGGWYPLVGYSHYGGDTEKPAETFGAYVNGAYKTNGIIFAVILARMLLFSEARFQWQRITDGRPGDLFGSRELAILENPWPNGTTGELLARMEQDVSLAGNFFAVREGDRLRRLRPDWVEIILSAPPDQAVRSDVKAYRYTPGGPMSDAEPEYFMPEQVCHWTPIPDPDAQYRGMSWITPVIRELQADHAATEHKAKFFENAATPNLAVSLKEGLTPEQFQEFVDAMDAQHKGVRNAYKTLYTAGGADVTVIGADLQQLDFKATQGAGETRICAAGGVPPIIVGLSEGLQASTYSNYGMARRKFGDHWARPQWRSACAALSSLVTPPPGNGAVRLWYDDRDIAFLREDEQDRAQIAQIEATTMAALVREGWTAESVVQALMEGDWSLLQHSGLYSVQLWPPGTTEPNASPDTQAQPEE
jgi:phage portal protein BeeE